MNAITPIPSIIPENAPFSSEQRAWLNGFFAAYLGVSGNLGDGLIMLLGADGKRRHWLGSNDDTTAHTIFGKAGVDLSLDTGWLPNLAQGKAVAASFTTTTPSVRATAPGGSACWRSRCLGSPTSA